MALSIGKVEGIHTLVVSLTGIALVTALWWGFLGLERQQQRVGDDALALRDFTRMEDSVRQWLLMGDLVYGSGETYLIEGAESLGRLAEETGQQLAAGAFAGDWDRELDVLSDLLRRNNARLTQAAQMSPETEMQQASQLLSEWDTDAAQTVALLHTLRDEMTRSAQNRDRKVAGHRSMLITLTALAGTFYVALVLLMWRWVRAFLVAPLRALTDAADRALQFDEPLDLEERGPAEVRRLTRSTKAFVGELERRVEDRTRDLRVREEALIGEVATRRAAEQAAARAQEIAEAANDAMSEFLANVSHEIRTPMNGVLGGAELALQAADNDDQRSAIRIILSSGKQLLGVINDILDFSKLDAGHLGLESAQFDLHDALGDVGNLFAAHASQKGLELIMAPQVGVPRTLVGDSLRVGQILANLLSNAIKCTERGQIVVRVSLAEKSDATVSLRFEVQDTGIGIAPEEQLVVFDPFRQVDGSTTRTWTGTGLGLSICKRFVELMGGKIGLVRTVGKGSTFWCTMRFEKPASLPAPDRMVGNRSARVSVPNDTLSAYLESYLQHWGCHIADASAMSPPEKADVLLIDGEHLTEDAWPARDAADSIIVLKSLSQSLPERPGYTYITKPVLPDELYVALANQQQATDPAAVELDQLPQFDLRVLVVEDNAVNQLIARKMLVSLGCDVTVAVDGTESITAVQTETFDLVLMDWHMPGMDGLEATRKIRAWEASTQRLPVPILALTANAMGGDERICLDAGMDGYLSKPVNVATLAGALPHSTNT